MNKSRAAEERRGGMAEEDIVRENLSQAAKMAQLGPWKYDFATEMFEFNDDFYAIYGTDTAHEGIFMSREKYKREFVHPEDLHMLEWDVAAAMKEKSDEGYLQMEHRIIRRDGEVRTVKVRIDYVRDPGGRIVRWYGVNQDITEYRAMAEALLAGKEKLSLAAELARLAPWRYDLRRNLFEFDDEFYVIYGTDALREGLVMEPETYAKKFLPAEDENLVKAELDRIFSSTARVYSHQIEHRIIRRDGAVRMIAVKIRAVRDIQGNLINLYGANQDITERKMVEQELKQKNEELFRINKKLQQEIEERIEVETRLKYVSFHDSLTGLFNRAFFVEELQRATAESFFPLTILMADLDGLKLVNDNLGHLAGDELIKRAADVLRCSLRNGDILARVGGDEFAAVLPRTDAAAGEKILLRIEASLSTLAAAVPLAISVGVATSLEPVDDLEDLCQHADRNMYMSKRRRKQAVRNKLLSFLQKHKLP